MDHYGRPVPKHAHGTANLEAHSSSSKEIISAVMSLYDSIVNKDLLIRRLNITTNHVVYEEQFSIFNGQCSMESKQLDLFADYQSEKDKRAERAKERRMQEALLNIKHRFGKNAILKGTSYAEGATAKERNKQIGGHKA